MTWLPEWEQNEEEHRFSAGFVDKGSVITLERDGGAWWARIYLVMYGKELCLKEQKLKSAELDDAKREAHALMCQHLYLIVHDLRQIIEQHQQRSAAIEREGGQR